VNVLVMGNGGSVINNEFGEIIDSKFDVIFRMNRFKTEGFEKYVGSKTDAWVTVDYAVDWIINGHDECPATQPRILDTIPYVYFFIPEFKYDYEFNRISSLGFNQDKYQIIPKTIESQINSRLNFKPGWPLTGTILLQMLVNDYENIYIHGFDMFDKSYEFYHYYDDKDESKKTDYFLKNNKEHDISKDKKMMDIFFKEYNVKVLSNSIGDFADE
jgi:hypothetical protein